jgi:hypothetical protein
MGIPFELALADEPNPAWPETFSQDMQAYLKRSFIYMLNHKLDRSEEEREEVFWAKLRKDTEIFEQDWLNPTYKRGGNILLFASLHFLPPEPVTQVHRAELAIWFYQLRREEAKRTGLKEFLLAEVLAPLPRQPRGREI